MDAGKAANELKWTDLSNKLTFASNSHMPVAYRQGQKAQYVDITLRLGRGGGCHLRHTPMSKVSDLIFSQVEVEAQDLHPLLHIKGLICTSYSSSYSTSVRKTVVYRSSSWWLSVLKVGNMIK